MREDGPQQEKGEFPTVGEGGVTAPGVTPEGGRSYYPRGYCPRSYCPRSYYPRNYCTRNYCPRSYCPRNYCPRSYCPRYLYVQTGAAAAVLGTQHCWRENSAGVTKSPVNLLCSSAWGIGQDQLQEAKMSLPPRGAWLGGAGGRSSDIEEELKVEQLLLCAERSPLRWFRHRDASLRTWFRPVQVAVERLAQVANPRSFDKQVAGHSTTGD